MLRGCALSRFVRVLVTFRKCANAAFWGHPNSIFVYSSLQCHIVLVNKATAIEECDKHCLSHCILLSDFLLLRRGLAPPMYTFLTSEVFKIVHPTFVAHYQFLKQIWLLLKHLKPLLTNFNTSCYLFMCEQMWYPCRWHTSHFEILWRDMVNCWLGNVRHVLQNLNSQMLVILDQFSLIPRKISKKYYSDQFLSHQRYNSCNSSILKNWSMGALI